MKHVMLNPSKTSMPLIGYTAAVYKNETDIGNSLKTLLPKYGLRRSDIFITSKLGPKDHGTGKCAEACLKSLSHLDCDYLDLYLIHWPGTQGMRPEDERHPALRLESWRDMETLVDQGKVKAIGVSNYTLKHLQELETQCRIPPSVLQTEFHPHLVCSELVQYCQQKNIHFQAYSSLGTSTDNQLIEDKTVQSIAEMYKKSPAQILLRWAVQQNIGIIPKSTNPVHIRENAAIFDFDISPVDMERLSSLNRSLHYCWNPENVT
ncbi:uncharacterized oxidoreductase YtbE-like isoform X2 [Liolophura sinensis]|uniref:uncharacterized oxidoreductase YtbE-like isoform X2 n=1 Tax=Liolophura sinensis TaxID=3198878 RepID=UPI00315960B3